MKKTCDADPPLLLAVPETIGDQRIDELVTVEFEWTSWIPEHFPLPAHKGRSVTQADFAAIIADIRQKGAQALGPDFDRPSSSQAAE
jgi:hypothetical protein